ncbi:MAG: hypothetical protein ABI162_07640 [Luteolibacter sp.]
MKAKKNLLNNGLRRSGVCLSLVSITFCCQSLHAADWAGGTSTDWNTAANWTGTTVPATVPNDEWASIWTGAGNVPVISAVVTGAPRAVNVGNGRLDQTAGTLALAGGGAGKEERCSLEAAIPAEPTTLPTPRLRAGLLQDTEQALEALPQAHGAALILVRVGGGIIQPLS